MPRAPDHAPPRAPPHTQPPAHRRPLPHRHHSQEDALILRGHAALGARWTEIAKLLPGRTDNAIKNRWNGTLSKAAQEAGQVPGQPTVLSGLCLAASLETDPSPECN